VSSLACAGVWRRKTIVTVGGWQSRTTVEDMDLSLRTFVNGWKAIYLLDVTCINEVRLISRLVLILQVVVSLLVTSKQCAATLAHLCTCFPA
jgi:hypothetical protein